MSISSALVAFVVAAVCLQPNADQVAERLKEIDRQIESLQAEREQLETQLEQTRDDEPGSTTAQAREQYPGQIVHPWGDAVEVGDLTVRLKRLSCEKRSIGVKQRFDLDDRGFQDILIPFWGVLVEVENRSPGRVICPFPEDNMFGGKANIVVADNWDNKLVQQSMSSTKVETRPGKAADFVLPGEEIVPGERKTYFFPIAEPKVSNYTYMVVRVQLQVTNRNADAETLLFHVPKDDVLITAKIED